MITDERLTTFINSLESRDLPILEEIEQEALDANVPIIRKEPKLSEGIASDPSAHAYTGKPERQWDFPRF